jgi:Lipopolysaccharide kinase (Kdo/WaaP) family
MAVRLGRALAAIHAAGFHHPDLYSKHVLVGRDPATGAVTFAFLDWQRAGRRRLRWARCWRELAALDATIADELVTPRERLACLHAYCRSFIRARSASKGFGEPLAGAAGLCGGLAWAGRVIRRHALHLLRRRRIREMRQPPLAADFHQLVQLTPPALCVTRQFRDELAGQVPPWLRFPGEGGVHVLRAVVPVTPARQAALVRRRASRPLKWLWHWLRGRPLVSPEVAQAGTLFRLERYGIRTPRLLAFGQRSSRPWLLESLLVTEAPDDTLPLGDWLRQPAHAMTQQQRRRLVREAGEVIRRMHAAACYFGNTRSAWDSLRVQTLPDGSPRVLLVAVEAIRQRHRAGARFALWDLATLWAEVGGVCGRTDALRCLLAYLDVPRLTPEARRLAGRILRATPSVRPRLRAVLRGGNA